MSSPPPLSDGGCPRAHLRRPRHDEEAAREGVNDWIRHSQNVRRRHRACPVDLHDAYDLDGIASPTDPGGTPFSLPSSADGVRNTVVSSGETISLAALTGRTLRVLAPATGGSVGSTARVTYADGMSASVPLGASDWAGGPAGGEFVGVAALPRFRNPSGTDGPPVSIHDETLPLDPTKILRSVTLMGDLGGVPSTSIATGEKVRGKFAEVVAHPPTRRYK